MATTLSKTDSKECKSYTQHLQARAQDDIIVQYTLASGLKSQHSRKLSPPQMYSCEYLVSLNGYLPPTSCWEKKTLLRMGGELLRKRLSRHMLNVLKLEPKNHDQQKLCLVFPFKPHDHLISVVQRAKQ